MNTLVQFIGLVFLIGLIWFAASDLRGERAIIYPPPLDVPKLIRSIKAVENWDGRSTGARGEWGELQMLPAIRAKWGENEVGYVNELVGECYAIQRVPSPYLVGLLHNAGLSKVISGRVEARHYDFSQRVSNVYYDQP